MLFHEIWDFIDTSEAGSKRSLNQAVLPVQEAAAINGEASAWRDSIN